MKMKRFARITAVLALAALVACIWLLSSYHQSRPEVLGLNATAIQFSAARAEDRRHPHAFAPTGTGDVQRGRFHPHTVPANAGAVVVHHRAAEGHRHLQHVGSHPLPVVVDQCVDPLVGLLAGLTEVDPHFRRPPLEGVVHVFAQRRCGVVIADVPQGCDQRLRKE